MRGHLLRIVGRYECKLGFRPQKPYYGISGSAAGRWEFDDDVNAGPEADARIRSIAAALDGEAADTLFHLLTTIELSEKVVPSLKSDLTSFDLRLEPGGSFTRPRPVLRLTVKPVSDPSPDVVAIRVPEETAAQIIDDLDRQGFFFRGIFETPRRAVRTKPLYTMTVHSPTIGSVVLNYEPAPASPPMHARLQWLRRLMPQDEAAAQMDGFLERLKDRDTDGRAGGGEP